MGLCMSLVRTGPKPLAARKWAEHILLSPCEQDGYNLSNVRLRFCFFQINVCLQGKCEKRVQDVIERFWDFIDQLSINTFGKLRKSQILKVHKFQRNSVPRTLREGEIGRGFFSLLSRCCCFYFSFSLFSNCTWWLTSPRVTTSRRVEPQQTSFLMCIVRTDAIFQIFKVPGFL